MKNKNILIILTTLTFIFSHEMLEFIYPNARNDYEVFLKYYYAKEIVNELLFTLLFFTLFICVKQRLFSSISIFAFMLTFSSFLDKAFLNNYDYLYTDIIIIVIATLLSIKVYKWREYHTN